MLLYDNAMTDVEAQTRTLSRGLRGVERIEDLLLSLDRNPWSAVRDLDDAQVDDITRAIRLIMAAARRGAGPGRKPTARARG